MPVSRAFCDGGIIICRMAWPIRQAVGCETPIHCANVTEEMPLLELTI